MGHACTSESSSLCDYFLILTFSETQKLLIAFAFANSSTRLKLALLGWLTFQERQMTHTSPTSPSCGDRKSIHSEARVSVFNTPQTLLALLVRSSFRARQFESFPVQHRHFALLAIKLHIPIVIQSLMHSSRGLRMTSSPSCESWYLL